MILHSIRWLALLAVLVLPLQAHADTHAGPDVSQYTLENGLRLLVIPDRRAPVVTHMLWYRAGAADDPPGKSGVAHFLEHLMFKGTANAPGQTFSRSIAEIGGQENAFTSHDYTAYFQKVSPDALRRMMAFEADRMRNLELTDAVVLPERDVILEERSSRVDNSPASILYEFVQAALFVHHPYGIPVIGWEHEIAKLSRQDALAFYEKWYQPWNATVVVAGDVSPDEVFELARDTYGKVQASNPARERDRLRDPQPVVAKQLEYRDRRVANPVWQKTFIVPSYRTAENGEAEALDLLATIIGNSVSSRIYRKLVLDEEIATSAGAFYQGSSRDHGSFVLYATPRGDTAIEDVASAVEREVKRILESGVKPEELDRARKSYLKTLIFGQDSQVSLARVFGAILSTGGSVEDYLNWPRDLEEVDVDDINAVASKYLSTGSTVSSYLLPEE